ncbi:MAG: FecR family protein [Treponema sp.]|jgi:hypothetical protein|nr:FecR family protein [Treponema sp.]
MKNRTKALFAALFFSGALALSAQEESPVLIRELRGRVEVKEPGAADWTPARQGQSLARTAQISTGFGSAALLELGDTLIMLRALTRVRLDEMPASEHEGSGISLETGRIRAEAKTPAGEGAEFTLRGSGLSASSRGASFEFDGTGLAVERGRVRVSVGGRSGTHVGAGRRLRTAPDSGRALGSAEAMGEDLVPPAPAGMNPGPIKLAPPADGANIAP